MFRVQGLRYGDIWGRGFIQPATSVKQFFKNIFVVCKLYTKYTNESEDALFTYLCHIINTRDTHMQPRESFIVLGTWSCILLVLVTHIQMCSFRKEEAGRRKRIMMGKNPIQHFSTNKGIILLSLSSLSLFGSWMAPPKAHLPQVWLPVSGAIGGGGTLRGQDLVEGS